MREQMRGKMQSFTQRELWQGRSGWRRGLFALFWSGVRFWLAQWVWGTGLRLAHFPEPTKNAGVALALVSALLFIWAAWGLVKAMRALGLKRCVALLLAVFLIVVGIGVLTLPPDQSRVSGLFRQLVVRAEGGGAMLGGMVQAIVQAPGEFNFAYTGTRSPPNLPAGFPTANPQAIPIQVIARRAGQLLPPPVQPRASSPSETGASTQTSPQLQVGGFAQVVNTEGQTLQARERPGMQAAVATRFPVGTRLSIIAGPQQADGYTWWQVRNEKGQQGWCADAWLESIN